jgi:geranylgeranyl reductase family protein
VQTWDAIVVGGGPAGSSCAWKLRQAGLSVLLLDKKPFPRDKPCAGWITPQVVAALQLDVEAYRRGRTWQPICGFSCGTLGGGQIQVDYGQVISYGIRRCQFDHYLLHRCGAELRLGEAVVSIQRRENLWCINDRYQAPVLVGAGGHFCPVARHLGARRQPTASQVVAQEIEFEASPKLLGHVAPDQPWLLFCRDLKGYGWCFRKEQYLNIGLGRTQAEGFADAWAELRAHLAARGLPTPDRSAWKGHAYQLYDAPPTLVGDGVLLVGDAAGLAYAHSGEGIRPAVESGLLAAQTILSAQKPYDQQQLAAYPQRIRERLGQPRPSGGLGWLPQRWRQALATRLLRQRWFAQGVVMDRWFLHRADPPLAVEGCLPNAEQPDTASSCRSANHG